MKRLTYLFTLVSLCFSQTASAAFLLNITATTYGFPITPGVAINNQLMTTIDISADNVSGYTSYNISLNDNNSGNLVLGGNNIPYTLVYNGNTGSPVSFSGGAVTVENSVLPFPFTAQPRDLAINIAAGASLGIPSGTYSTTITITFEVL